LLPYLGYERVSPTGPHEGRVEADPALILVEEDADRRAEYRLGRGLHVVARVPAPKLWSALLPGDVTLYDDVPLVYDDECPAVAAGRGVVVVVCDGFIEYGRIDAQSPRLGDAPAALAFWRWIVVLV